MEQLANVKNNKRKKVQLSGGDKLFMVFVYVYLTITLIIVLLPLIHVLASSFSSPSAILAGRVTFLPVDFSLQGYKVIFGYDAVWLGYANSIFYAVAGTFINLVLTTMAAYPLSRKKLPFRGPVMAIFTFTMIFNGGMIPTYMVLSELGGIDKRWALLILPAIGIYQMIIARTFFMSSIPQELSEAAEIDGATDVRFIISCVVPLSLPIFAVLGLMYAVMHWNQYFWAMIILDDSNKWPLQIVLRRILIQTRIDPTEVADVEDLVARQHLYYLMKYTLIVVASVPVLALYPFVQKYFIKGMLIGSVKG